MALTICRFPKIWIPPNHDIFSKIIKSHISFQQSPLASPSPFQVREDFRSLGQPVKAQCTSADSLVS